MTERFDVVVVGSGAGGGLVAGELADSGRRVLLLELGPHRTAADFTRWEAKANHDIWWPKGAMALRLGLHKGLRGIIPEQMMSWLLTLRAKWYASRVPRGNCVKPV